ncbi:hypothetical protein [Rhodopseudomonas palustris]|uniref:Uncharacterized protein n=1 Tax=Rhodopseudomonas palustris (strain ATCC BAA-98 / CGA009) TaxID=258594 RepID=A0AAF0BR53_RHOPA|nr:hypothetical protein [Rhodopseudomonas palustris]WAB76716.1 hypothetical protein OR798_19800 [Rhodopseudomonas palustris]WCL94001.1 hypothetical protein TX73_019795 [Rhodopseudomonas palustris CGA009]WND50628.1 hypothetical protein L1A21_19720 [Rhodopseudomonas palustris]
MSIEDLVDDFWRDALRSNATGEEAQAKWLAFVQGLQDRVAYFPKEAQDEVFLRAVTHNAQCIGMARVDLDALRQRLGVPVSHNKLVEAAADTVIRETLGLGMGALFRIFR